MTDQPTPAAEPAHAAQPPVAAQPDPAAQPDQDPETIGDLMSPALAVFRPETTVAEATEALRELTRAAMITYCYVTDEAGKLLGVVVMRDMLLATSDTRLDAIMLKEPFWFPQDCKLEDALKTAAAKHFPVYPICDAQGHLVGLVRGEELFRNQAIEISAQSGKMVGVDKEERTYTPFSRSLRFRHPWLQINLLTAFAAAAVVGVFEGTIERLVVLAVFLPVMAGQTGNTGLQALAVTLRGMTLGELKPGSTGGLLAKETGLGFFNGLLVGITAGLGMLVYAWTKGEPEPWMLGFTVLAAMTASCTVAGFAGASIPLVLKRCGADPATSSGIFLTTASDIGSLSMFLGIATILLL
jgi:magnesium transporter